MKKKVVCLLTLCLLFLSNTALAANWTHMGGGSSTLVGNYDAYVDKDSIMKNGDNVVYWELEVLDVVDENTRSVKDMFRIEATVSNPRQYRVVEYYAYDINDRVVAHYAAPTAFAPVDSQLTNKEIDFAIQNVK